VGVVRQNLERKAVITLSKIKEPIKKPKPQGGGGGDVKCISVYIVESLLVSMKLEENTTKLVIL